MKPIARPDVSRQGPHPGPVTITMCDPPIPRAREVATRFFALPRGLRSGSQARELASRLAGPLCDGIDGLMTTRPIGLAIPVAVALAMCGCEKQEAQPPLATDVAVAMAPPESLPQGPEEAQIVFQQGPPPPAKVKPKPKPAEPKAEPAKAEPARPDPPKMEPKPPEPKGLTVPASDGSSASGSSGRPAPPPTPPAPPPTPPPTPAKPAPVRSSSLPAGNFDAGTAQSFREIAVSTGGSVLAAASAGQLPGAIQRLLGTLTAVPDLDMVLLIDTTGSMRDDLAAMRSAAASVLSTAFARPGKTRVGVVYYKDKTPDCTYVTKMELALSEDKGDIAGALARAKVDCGGDFPEHVYAGIHRAATGMSWRPEAAKVIVLIGDAPPHDDYPDVTRGMAIGAAKSRGIGVTSIIVNKD